VVFTELTLLAIEGFGGVVSPLICQTLVGAGIPWKQFYFGSLVLSAFNTGFLTLTFKPTTKEWIRECNKVKRQNENLERRTAESTRPSLDGKLDEGPSSSQTAAPVQVSRPVLAAPRSGKLSTYGACL
jgi:hypothetical protein